MNSLKTLPLLLFSLCCTLPCQAQVSASICGPLNSSHYGPFDYRGDHHKQLATDPISHAEKRYTVEEAHFSARVENLVGAQSGGGIGPPGPDLSYTLRAFPNHHRALVAAMRYGQKFKTENPPGLQYPVECYFERAVRFTPEDVLVRIIYSAYLTKKERIAEALTQLQISSGLAANSPFTHFNIGLAYFDLKEYDLALQSAHRAWGLGFERPELQEKLKSVGKWQEPVPADTAASAAASAPISASSPEAGQDKP